MGQDFEYKYSKLPEFTCKCELHKSMDIKWLPKKIGFVSCGKGCRDVADAVIGNGKGESNFTDCRKELRQEWRE